MKIILLENPGYAGMELVSLPAEVEASARGGKAYIPREELYKIGAESGVFGLCPEVCIPAGFWEPAE